MSARTVSQWARRFVAASALLLVTWQVGAVVAVAAVGLPEQSFLAVPRRTQVALVGLGLLV
jgi:hypothetical protein